MRVPTIPTWRRPSSPQDEGALWLTWLVRLRWVAILAQTITLSLVNRLFDAPWAVPVLVGVEILLVVANFASMRRVADEHDVGQPFLFSQLLLDVCALTVFFVLGGGPDNPFTSLYLIHVAMGAIMLQPAWAAVLTGLVITAHGLLHAWHLPLHLERHSLGAEALTGVGAAVSISITAGTIGFFVLGLANTLRWRERLLLDARDRTARTDRLRSVGTMAAGAAHELNTPLATIGLRLRRVVRRHQDADTTNDLGVIRDQLDRCETIVRQLLVSAGDPAASELRVVAVHDLVEDAVALWSHGTRAAVTVTDTSEAATIAVPRAAFVQGLVNLLENAREAQEEAGRTPPIELILRAGSGRAEIVVRDHGSGLPPQPDRVGEPFFTTKSDGTGLGVYVARAVADGSGGGLRYEGGAGFTEAHWWFPLAGGQER
jgi:two-component system sensor histidine kinase RegB